MKSLIGAFLYFQTFSANDAENHQRSTKQGFFSGWQMFFGFLWINDPPNYSQNIFLTLTNLKEK